MALANVDNVNASWKAVEDVVRVVIIRELWRLIVLAKLF